MIARVAFFLFAMTLCGCGPSAKQIADQQARQRFKESVAAVKVCTQGSTYAEFREKRLALATSYAANQSALADESSQIEHLEKVMIATDALWEWQVKFSELPSGPVSGWVADGWAEDPWEAMLTISPSVAAKAFFRSEQRRKDPDFYAKNYVHRGLTMISEQCDELLK